MQVVTEIMGYIHTLPRHSHNQSILKKKRVLEIDMVNKKAKSDTNQFKAELANGQSGKLSLSRVTPGEYSKERSKI